MDNKKQIFVLQTKRDFSLDTVAGIMILYMMFLHCCQFAKCTGYPFFKWMSLFFSGFMAWFFFKSGIFHHEKYSVRMLFINVRNKLMRPYIVFMTLGYFVYVITLYKKNDLYWVHYILTPLKQCLLGGGVHEGALPLWFLVTLLFVKSLSPLFIERFKEGWIVCGLIGCFLDWVIKNENILIPYYFTNFFPGMFFYGLGYNMKYLQYKNITLYIMIVIFIISIIFPSMVDFRRNLTTDGMYILWLIYASADIMILNYISKNISVKIWPFIIIGNKSMYCFLFHWPLLTIIHLMVIEFCPGLSKFQMLIIMSISLIIILILLYPIVYKTRLKILFGI